MRRTSLLLLALLLWARPASAAQTCVAYGNATCEGGTAGTISGTGLDNQVARWDGTTDIQGSGCSLDDSGVITCANQNSLGVPAPNLTAIYDNCGVAASCTDCPTGTFCLIDVNSGCGVYDVRVCFGSTGLAGSVLPDSGNTTVAQSRVFRGNANTSGQWLVDTYDVRDFGALGDGSTDDTTAIRNAIWAACTATGPATVYFPGTSAYYKISERLPVYSESTAHIPANTPASAMVSGCESEGVPLPCCAARNLGYCGVEPYRCDGITFLGDGPKKSRIVQTYTENTTNGDTLSTRPVFELRAADWITFRGLSLENGTTKATYGSGSSKSTIASYLLAREYRAGIVTIDGVDHLLVDNVHFDNFVADIRARGHSNNTTLSYDTTVLNSTSSKSTYGALVGFDNQVGIRLDGWKGSVEQSESNAPHGLYIAADSPNGRIYDVQIANAFFGDWDGAGVGCDPDGDGLSLRNITGLNVTNVEAVGCGIGGLVNVAGATVTNTRGRALSTALGTVGGCWNIQSGTTDLDLGDFYCNAGDILNPTNCVGSENPVKCCTGSGTGPTCKNSPIIDLNATGATDHVKRIHIHDGEIHGYNPVAIAFGAIHVSGSAASFLTADYLDIHDIDVFNDYTATGVAWPALRVAQRGFFNSARAIRQFPKSTAARPVRFDCVSGGQCGEWFLDLPDPPGFDDSTLPDVDTVQKNSEVLCHNCQETSSTGICTTGWTNSNILARFDGQNWICGDGVIPTTPTPTATATRTATPTVTPTAATVTPTPTVTPTLATPLPTP